MHDEDRGIYIGNKRIIVLTVNENKILSLLIKNKRTPVTYDEISRAIYSCDIDKCLKNCISRTIYDLRKKFQNEFRIYNVKGWGYFIK